MYTKKYPEGGHTEKGNRLTQSRSMTVDYIAHNASRKSLNPSQKTLGLGLELTTKPPYSKQGGC
jgi:hypothetical protein